jgi:hypothetical protein
VSVSTDTLFFLGYPTAEPGDVITVWRNDWCVGHLHCETIGGFWWQLTIGQIRAKQGVTYSTLDEAKQGIADAFKAWCHDQFLTVAGPSRVPSGYREAKVWIPEKARTFKVSGEAEGFMRSTDVRRHLSGMDRTTRREVGQAALAHIANLQAQERPLAEAV